MRFIVTFITCLQAVCASSLSSTNVNSQPDLFQALSNLKLSPNARIIFPNDTDWSQATMRWDPWSIPDLRVSISAATTADVSRVVRFASTYRIPLLVRASSHGYTATVQKIQKGIQLSLEQLDDITISPSGDSITLGGGVRNAHLVEAMFQAGKRTATGGCDCVGVNGLGLGGGHGKLQGYHGLVSDSFKELEVVTADGSVHIVNERQNKELFWAMKGAGHNFGVVTKLTLHLYPKQDSDDWINAEYIYTHDQLTQVFTYLNSLLLNSHPALTIFTSYSTSGINPLTDDPVIRVSIQFGGGVENYPEIAAPFLAMSPIRNSTDVVPLNKIATATGIGLNMGFCLGGTVSRGHYSAQIPRFENFTALEAAYDIYKEVIRDPRFSGTGMVWEQYPQQRFKEIEPESSAYPWRDDNFLSLIMINFVGEENQEDAVRWGLKAREVLKTVGGDGKLRCYTNYAQGDEDWRIWYGYGWREKKLRELKKKWDPKNLFNNYNPITV